MPHVFTRWHTYSTFSISALETGWAIACAEHGVGWCIRWQQVFVLKVLSFFTPWRYPGQHIHPPSKPAAEGCRSTAVVPVYVYDSSTNSASDTAASSRQSPAEIQPPRQHPRLPLTTPPMGCARDAPPKSPLTENRQLKGRRAPNLLAIG